MLFSKYNRIIKYKCISVKYFVPFTRIGADSNNCMFIKDLCLLEEQIFALFAPLLYILDTA